MNTAFIKYCVDTVFVNKLQDLKNHIFTSIFFFVQDQILGYSSNVLSRKSTWSSFGLLVKSIRAKYQLIAEIFAEHLVSEFYGVSTV